MPTALVEFKDGTTMNISGDSEEDIMRKAERFAQAPGTKDPTRPNTFLQGLTENTAGGLLGIPEIAAQLTARAPRGLDLLGGGQTEEGAKMPFSGNLLGLPTGREALAGLESVRPPRGLDLINGDQSRLLDTNEKLGQRFNQNINERQQLQQEHPTQQFMGELTSDIGLTMLGRAPFLKNTSAAEKMHPMAMKRSMGGTDIIAPQIEKGLKKIGLSEGPRKFLSELSGRTFEGGLEGAALSMVHGRGEESPYEQAVYAAGTQFGGFMGNKITQTPRAGIAKALSGDVEGSLLKLGATAAAMTVLVMSAKMVTPGGDDYILPSIESGFDKLPFALLLGMASGLTGAGRIGNSKAPMTEMNMSPAFMDAVSTIPRAATIKLMRDFSGEDGEEIETALGKTLSSFDLLTPKQAEKMNKGFSAGDFLRTYRDMMQNDESFFDLMNSPEGLEGVPIKKDEK